MIHTYTVIMNEYIENMVVCMCASVCNGLYEVACCFNYYLANFFLAPSLNCLLNA